jgi:hypothetical protein
LAFGGIAFPIVPTVATNKPFSSSTYIHAKAEPMHPAQPHIISPHGAALSVLLGYKVNNFCPYSSTQKIVSFAINRHFAHKTIKKQPCNRAGLFPYLPSRA